MSDLALSVLIFLFALPWMAFGSSLKYDSQKVTAVEKSLQYKSPKINFSTKISPCTEKLIFNYFQEFEQKKQNKLDELKTKKAPVSYTLNDKELKTYKGSRTHHKLEAIGKDILLLKYRVEKKCS